MDGRAFGEGLYQAFIGAMILALLVGACVGASGFWIGSTYDLDVDVKVKRAALDETDDD